jgi:hypothetical protein
MRLLATAWDLAVQDLASEAWRLAPWTPWVDPAWVDPAWVEWEVAWAVLAQWVGPARWGWAGQVHWVLVLLEAWPLREVLVAAFWRGGRRLHLVPAQLLRVRC